MKLKKIINFIRHPYDRYKSLKENRKRLDNKYKSMRIKSMSDFNDYANYKKQQDYDDIFKFVIVLVFGTAIVIFAVAVIK